MKKLGIIMTALCAVIFLSFLFLLGFWDQREAMGKQNANAAETSKGESKQIGKFEEKRWTFNIQNGNIRFSHGNHKRRDRWFKAYFGTGYDDCGNCHNLGLLKTDEVYSLLLGEGEHLNTVEAIRAAKDDIFPYGVQEASCLTCHDETTTAPANCAWCHVPGSRALQPMEAAAMKLKGSHEGTPEKEESPSYEEDVARIIPEYNEDYKKGIDTIREYKEKNWFFDIQNDGIRFSHGNHSNRDRWFKVYAGTTYKDCGNCHNLGLPFASAGGVLLKDDEHLNSVEDVQDFEDDIYPYGIMMARCFGSCHNGLAASNECINCHLPGSKPVVEGMTERTM
jgi:hypothetical protein